VKFEKLPWLFAMALLPAQTLAVNYMDGGGNEYSSTANDHGVVLKSSHAVLYLGKACDAFSPQYGKGTWAWANGGFLVRFGRVSIGFPRQELNIDNGNGCQM
jgi:hypothetical protein